MTKRISKEKKQRILELHRNIQRVLEPVEVNNPFGEHLTFPASTSRRQRDIGRFINLFKTVAFLRQMQKQQKTSQSPPISKPNIGFARLWFALRRVKIGFVFSYHWLHWYSWLRWFLFSATEIYSHRVHREHRDKKKFWIINYKFWDFCAPHCFALRSKAWGRAFCEDMKKGHP